MTQETPDSDTGIDGLGWRYFHVAHTASPFNATLSGLTQFDHLCPDPLDDPGRAGTFRRIVAAAATLDVSSERRADKDTLVFLAEAAADDAEHALWAASTSTEGFVSPQAAAFQAVPVVNVDEPTAAERYLARLEGLPDFFDRLGDRARYEAARGRPSTRRGLVAARDQLLAHASRPVDDDVFVRPAIRSGVAAVIEAARAVVASRVRPAMMRLAAVQERLIPAARDDDHVGIRFVADGQAAYEGAIHRHTGERTAPRTLHERGLHFVAELQQDWRSIGQSALGTDDFHAVVRHLRDGPGSRFRDADDMLATAAAALHRAEEIVPELFGADADPTRCQIEQIAAEDAPDAPPAYYRAPAADGSRPGALCLLTANPAAFARFEYEALTFHEAVPGHHLQAVAAAQRHLPGWRRHIDTELGSFVEGWALYAEQLADEHGLYSSAEQRLGMLSLAMVRAARVVVDTGLHALDWSRHRAETYLQENTPLTEERARREVQRYVAWPGQALSYTLGHQALLRARSDAKGHLGSSFDLRQFHRQVLRGGAVPPSALLS